MPNARDHTRITRRQKTRTTHGHAQTDTHFNPVAGDDLFFYARLTVRFKTYNQLCSSLFLRGVLSPFLRVAPRAFLVKRKGWVAFSTDGGGAWAWEGSVKTATKKNDFSEEDKRRERPAE